MAVAVVEVSEVSGVGTQVEAADEMVKDRYVGLAPAIAAAAAVYEVLGVGAQGEAVAVVVKDKHIELALAVVLGKQDEMAVVLRGYCDMDHALSGAHNRARWRGL